MVLLCHQCCFGDVVCLLLLASGWFWRTTHPPTDEAILNEVRQKLELTKAIGELDETGRVVSSFNSPDKIREIVVGIQQADEFTATRVFDNAGSFVLLDTAGQPLYIASFGLGSGSALLSDVDIVDGRIVAGKGPRNYTTHHGTTEHFIMLVYNSFWEAVHEGLDVEVPTRPSWGRQADN